MPLRSKATYIQRAKGASDIIIVMEGVPEAVQYIIYYHDPCSRAGRNTKHAQEVVRKPWR